MRNCSERGDDGRAQLHCFHVDEAGRSCSHKAIVEALGLPEADLFPIEHELPRSPGNGKTKSYRPRFPDPLAALARQISAYGPPTDYRTYHHADGSESFRV
jgi:hypothetical protein